MRSLGVAASLVLAGLPSHGHAAAKSIERYEQGGWRLTVQRDRFTGRDACSLRSVDGRVLFQPAALGFRFGRHRDTLAAWYRLDGGAPVRWENNYPALIASGANIGGPGLDNPTGGIVWIPIAELLGAKSVAIRVGAQGAGHVFRLGDFGGMADAGRRLGCRSDADYVF